VNFDMHNNQVHPVMDMLRNEKPVWLTLNSQAATLYIGKEPVGEEESP